MLKEIKNFSSKLQVLFNEAEKLFFLIQECCLFENLGEMRIVTACVFADTHLGYSSFEAFFIRITSSCLSFYFGKIICFIYIYIFGQVDLVLFLFGKQNLVIQITLNLLAKYLPFHRFINFFLK